MAARPSKLSVRLVLSKSTKGTHVYVPDDAASTVVMQSAYILKSALPEIPPQAITLTIEF